MMNIIQKLVRRFFIGKDQKFVFKKTSYYNFTFPKIKEIDIYIHIPFCKSMCPYCPYNRIRYEKSLMKRYFAALSKEIDIYKKKLGRIKINSIYIGGGTPTNAIDELALIIKKIKRTFNVSKNIAIETTIADINEENIQKMQTMGVDMLSIGIQSFNDKYLNFLGRNYLSKDINIAFKKIKQYNFKIINIDLIFAFPGQTVKEVLQDIKKANNLKVDQITTYPLFTFPYSTIGDYMKIKKIKMPNLFVRKNFYQIIYSYFKNEKYNIASVWSFQREKDEHKYSSVTRNKYIGFGAGAGSRLESIFYFNTFSVHGYEDCLLNENKLPIAIDMPISQKLSNLYWFYWKIYETNFLFSEFNKKSDWKLKALLKIFIIFGLCKKIDDSVHLTRKGAFWIHLVQNYFVLSYIDKVWSKMKKEAFPQKIDI